MGRGAHEQRQQKRSKQCGNNRQRDPEPAVVAVHCFSHSGIWISRLLRGGSPPRQTNPAASNPARFDWRNVSSRAAVLDCGESAAHGKGLDRTSRAPGQSDGIKMLRLRQNVHPIDDGGVQPAGPHLVDQEIRRRHFDGHVFSDVRLPAAGPEESCRHEPQCCLRLIANAQLQAGLGEIRKSVTPRGFPLGTAMTISVSVSTVTSGNRSATGGTKHRSHA